MSSPNEDPVVTGYDKAHGTYQDTISQGPDDVKLPSGAMPKGPDPKPFTLGPETAGTRE